MRIEIVDYEQRYRGIDIGKLHEQCGYVESQLYIAKGNEQALEKDLFELRDRIEQIIVKAGAMRPLTKKEKELRRKTPWVPENDLEQLCKKFVAFVSGPSNETFSTLAAQGKSDLPPTKPVVKPGAPPDDDYKGH